MSRREHPTIAGAMHDVDASQLAIMIAEAALYPTLNVQGSLSRNVNTDYQALIALVSNFRSAGRD